MYSFERQKNIKAATITGFICGALLVLFFIISWTIPTPAANTQEEGIEVNLGNSDIGSGDIQPLIPDPPSAAEVQVNTPPKNTETIPEEVKDVETNDNDKEAPNVSIPKPVKQVTSKPKIPAKEDTRPPTITKPKPAVVENPTPTPQKPKYIYKGGDGTDKGGNNADSRNNSQGQGVTGGKGDQGKINGSPNSDSYNGSGGSGKSGVSISRGLQGRRITKLPSFEDEFNENAKVAVDIKVDKTGTVLSATYQPRGSTTSDAVMRDIAIRKAKLLKFSPNPDGSDTDLGTIIFNFRLKN